MKGYGEMKRIKTMVQGGKEGSVEHKIGKVIKEETGKERK